MSREQVTRQVNIFIESGEAQRALDVLIKKEEKLKEALQGATDPKEVEKLKKELEQLQEPIDRARKKLSGELQPSLKELEAAARRVKNEFSRMSEGDEGYDAMLHKLHAANAALEEQKTKMGMVNHAMGSMWDQAKMMATGMIIGEVVMGALNWVQEGVSNMITGSAKIADELADIEKTTGMTRQQVEQVNRELQKIDTRTSASELRKLAEEAGKLGITGVEDIAKFVKEADQIKVALGEDLGEDAIVSIGKLSKIFHTEMLKIGSAINEIGANSEASERFSVDFLNRLAGTGPAVKLTADQLLGYGAALEVAGQSAEVSGTALSTFFIDFTRDTEKFGQAAGFASGELKKMIDEKGTNAAFLTFLERLKASNPQADQFLGKMQQLGVDGARGANVMLALSNNIDAVRQQQEIASKAMAEGTSLTNEFSKKNNNAAAELEKLKKNFQSMFEGEGIRSTAAGLIRTVSSLLTTLKALPQIIAENKVAVLTLVAGIALLNGAYIQTAMATIKSTVATIADNVVKRATTAINAVSVAGQLAYAYAVDFVKGRITLATAAQRIWNAVMALGAGPIGLIVVAISALAIGLSQAVGRTRELTAEQRVQADIAERVSQSTADTVNKMEMLARVAADANGSLDNRKKALQALIDINPNYLHGLTLENIATQQGKEILDTYIQSLQTKAELEAKSSLLTDRIKERDQAKIDREKQEKTLPTTIVGQIGAATADIVGYGPYAKYDEAVKKEKDLNEEVKTLQKDIDTAARKNVQTVLDTNKTAGDSAAGAVGLLQKLKKQLKDLQDQRDAAKDEKTIASLNAQIKTTQDRITQLEGGTTKSGKAAESAAKKWKDLAEELRKIATALMPDDLPGQKLQKDLSEVDNKYAILREKAKGNSKLLLEVERLYQLERSQLLDQYYRDDLRRMQDAADEQRQRREQQQQKEIEALQRLQQLNQDRLNRSVTNNKAEQDARNQLLLMQKAGKALRDERLRQLRDQEVEELKSVDATSQQAALIRKKYQQARGDVEKQYLLDQVNLYIDFAQQVTGILDTLDNAKTARENAELERDRRLNDRKKKNLEQQLQKGLITQKEYDRKVADIEKQQDARDKEIKTKQFRRSQRMQILQALMSGAQAVTSTLAAIPGPLDIATLGTMRLIQIGLAIATTAAQVATIASQKPPEFARGGRTSGPSHAEGGMAVMDRFGRKQAEVEGGEGILNKRTMGDPNRYTVSGTPSQIASKLNALHGGVHWEGGATLTPQWRSALPLRLNIPAIRAAQQTFAAGGRFDGGGVVKGEAQNDALENLTLMLGVLNQRLQEPFKAYTVLTEHNDLQERLSAIISDATMK